MLVHIPIHQREKKEERKRDDGANANANGVSDNFGIGVNHFIRTSSEFSKGFMSSIVWEY